MGGRVLLMTLPGLMFLAFLVLKLTGYLAWSWWWVTAPLWIPTIVISVIAVLSIIAVELKFSRS